MDIPIAALARQKGIRRKRVQLRPITPTMTLENELFAIYMDGIRAWREAIAELLAAYTEPSPITTDADGQQLGWLVDQAAQRADSIVFTQTEKLGRWVARVGNWHGSKTISSVLSALGIDIQPYMRLSDIRELLEDAIRQNVSLIRSLNGTTRTRVEAIIFDALVNRRSKKYVTDEIAKTLAITKKRARGIAGDQLHKLGISLTGFRNQQMGIKSYTWVTRHDDRVRPAHRARDGGMFAWANPPYDGPPGFAINCRCVAAPVVELG